MSKVPHYLVSRGEASVCVQNSPPLSQHAQDGWEERKNLRKRNWGGGAQRPVRVHQLEKKVIWTSKGTSHEW